MIKVYVKLNENDEIISVASSIFLHDTTDYIEIDEGEGDKYAHAQSQYLEKSICDEQGRYNYKLIAGQVIEIMEEDKPVIQPVEQVTTEERLAAVEGLLLDMVLGGIL